jgi:hypothetical protein
MSTAISTTTTVINYPSLMPDSRQARIIAANLEGEPMREQDLIRVPTPAGGATIWSIDNQGNVETTDEIIGLFVAEGKRGVLWPKDDPSGTRPLIVSHDLVVGYRVGEDYGDRDPKAVERYRIGDRKYDWQALATGPEFGWDSGKGGKGRKVKEHRTVAVLRLGDTWPILINIGPASLTDWNKRKRGLELFKYETIIGFKLVKMKNSGGQPYSQIVTRVAGSIPEDQGEAARKTYHVPLTAMFNAPPMGMGVGVGVVIDNRDE